MSISITPVSGSTADFNVAVLIKPIAYSTSWDDTSLLSRILAKASLNLIIDSNNLGVAIIVLCDLPRFLI